MRRRTFLRLTALSGSAAALPSWLAGCGGADGRAASELPDLEVAPGNSPYGRWVLRDGLPAFVYDADQTSLPGAEWDPILAPPTRRHWVMVGNRAIRLQAANDGTVGVFDERDGLRWLVAPDPAGSGVSVVEEADGRAWSTDFALRAGEVTPERTFGPTWFEVRDALAGLALERTLLCPDGEVPWLLVRVRISLAEDAAPRAIRCIERWQLRPRFLNLLEGNDFRRARAAAAVRYEVTESGTGLVAREVFADPDAGGESGEAARFLIGPPATLVLESLAGSPGAPRVVAGEEAHPALELVASLSLEPGETKELWYRFGHADGASVDDPGRLLAESLAALAARLPRAAATRAPAAAQELPWHAALLTGGLAVDRVIGGHTLDQASTYSYEMGFNGAARDPLQHALPLVYIEPALALSVLRNTCAWGKPDGDLPYALDGAKRPTNIAFRPSDQNLWALWLAAEYAAATGDLAAFDEPLAYHPARATEAVPLREHLLRQLRFFVDFVGRGARGHVRILNADWNDVAIEDSGADRDEMVERGSSVLNSAMAAWVLRVFAGLASRLGETAAAEEARTHADDLRSLVAAAWNGRWFHRAYAPDGAPVGDADCWLEVQPWALLCGAADESQARTLLDVIDRGHRAGSPLGARLRWPAPPDVVAAGGWGNATLGGCWYSINMTLVWAAARISPDLAWDEWRRMTLASHTEAYPEIWEGTLSGPDAWNAPESTRPGRTWAAPPAFAMQAFPVNNMHSHAQPLFSYLRLLGVEPTPEGALAIGDGGHFRSPSFRLDPAGHGELATTGPVVLETRHGRVEGGPGGVGW